jgi:transposase
MANKRYSTDLSDVEWSLLKPHLPPEDLGEGVVQGRAEDGSREAAKTPALREPAAEVGRGAHLRLDLAQPAHEQRPREALLDRRGFLVHAAMARLMVRRLARA